MLRILVQKFGGSSLASPEGREAAAGRVLHAVREGSRPVVVVSALGRRGDPYATDTLLDLARRERTALPARELDLLLACGEQIAAAVMCAVLRRHGLEAVALTGGQAGIVTDAHFGDARILRVDPQPLQRILDRGQVPVVAGFQGITEAGDITTLGRGGSDTTAAALGAVLAAEAIEIYTDVDGVYTADPRVVPEARTLVTVTYEEVAQMAVEGARVIHPRAIEIAMRANVPVRVRSTFSDAAGTLITHAWQADRLWTAREGRVVTGLAHIPGLALFKVFTPEGAGGHGRSELRIFRTLADAGISVDMINVSPERKAFVIREDEAAEARRLLAGLGFEVSVREGCVKITVIGNGMRGMPGVMARVVESLDAADVDILLSVDSHITISCLVAQEHLERAVRALHEGFDLAEGE
ncbi:MAG TPA: aspartate kinase [Bacillota bacterium]